MCRLAGYAGPPVPLTALLCDAPRSLAEQAVRPREQRSGRLNVDGTGIAWWAAGEEAPLRYRTAQPPWADENLSALAPRIASGHQLAVVRSATPGIPYGSTFMHPFVHGSLAGAHNGWLSPFRGRLARLLLARLPDEVFAAFDGMSDSLAIFLQCVGERLRRPHEDLAGVLRAALAAVAADCATVGARGTLNVALADARGIAVSRTGVGEPGASLSVLRDGARWPGASVVASEPLDDDPGWTPVPEDHLAVLTAERIRLTPITPAARVEPSASGLVPDARDPKGARR